MLGPVVTSPSFCKNETLVAELLELFPEAHLNREGHILKGQQLVEFMRGYDAAIVGTDPLSDAVISQLPDLKFVSKYGVGLDNVDQDALQRRGIPLGWSGGVNRRSVSEMALAFMIGLSRNLFITSQKLKNGEWDKSGGFQLSGKTIGIIGCGFVGEDLIRLLEPFECDILICDILDKSDTCQRYSVRQVDMITLLGQSDLVTLHVPLSEQTKEMVNHDFLAQMQRHAYLINTSRGGVVNEPALAEALQSGGIAGAAIDVYQREPASENPLLELPNLIGTPHIGGNAREAVLAMGRSAIEHLRKWAGR
ncbi:MAG: phosphoglycerate dehydrogenase [Leptospiraceae bacterium]|nr:phosphoglycerate dehydrogenase [Leptospiraceae bacterium]